MKRYILLRNNHESGPFTRQELKAHGLLPKDLVWIEGESAAWKNPAEIEELVALVPYKLEEDPSAIKPAILEASNQPVPSLQEYHQAIGSNDVYSSQIDAGYPAYAYNTKTVFRNNTGRSTNSLSMGSRFFGALVLAIGIGLCGFVAVNMWKQFGAGQPGVSEAVEIKSETLPVSNTAHAARATQSFSVAVQSPGFAIKKDSSIQSLTIAKKPALSLAATTVVQKKKASKDTASLNAKPGKDDALQQAENSDLSAKLTDEQPEPAPAVRQAPALQLSANDYKVGLFGGISDLEISITNPSGQKVEKAVIEIEYLKPNGSVVKSQTVTAENIAAGGTKTISAPSSSRGVKVRYHVTSVDVPN